MGETLTRKCFVISPIGAENSEVRRHADTVFNCIIQPACEPDPAEGGPAYVAERGDHKTAPGKITDQIYEDILEAELIIAVLTGANPNVYYELAIAQSAAKPVILLMEKGYEAPFDIKDQRIIYYDFDPQRIFHKTYVKQLRAGMNALCARRGRPLVPFAPHLAPLGDPMQAVYQRASEAEEDTVQLIREAEDYIWLSGYTLKGWTMNHDFVSALTERAPSLNQPVRIMLMAPDNPSLPTAMKTRDIFESTAQSALMSQESWARVSEGIKQNKPELRISRDKSLNYQIMMSEKAAIVIPYLTSRDTLRSPYIYARQDSFYHEALMEEFDFVWGHAHVPAKAAPNVRVAPRPVRKKKA